MSRRAIVAATVLMLAVLAGCAAQPAPNPNPTPTPTPTPGFTSEADAYRAAEDTYRAYVDAANAADTRDPATFEDVYKWATGDALAADKKTFPELYSKHAVKTGDAVIMTVESREADERLSKLAIDVCQDVSHVDVRNEAGDSLVDPSRPDVQMLLVRLVSSDQSPTGLLVSGIWSRSDGVTC